MLIFPSDVNKGQCLSIMTSSNPKREGRESESWVGGTVERGIKRGREEGRGMERYSALDNNSNKAKMGLKRQ